MDSKHKSSLKTFKGYELPTTFPKIQKEIEDLEVYDDDVWVATFPKSGTTWVQEIVWLITHNLDYEGAKVDLDERCGFLEYSSLHNFENTTTSVDQVKNAKRPRVIKTHLPWELLPKQIRSFEKRPKIITITRNAKDVGVSYYNHARKRMFYTGTVEEFLLLFLENKVLYTPFFKHQLSYELRRGESNVLHLQYEVMLQDLLGQIEIIAKYFNVELSDENAEKLTKHASFKSMMQNSAVQHKTRAKDFPGTNFDGDGFFRKGIAGGYKEVMNDELNCKFDEWITNYLVNKKY